MISHERRCIFVHIPRTGGTSLENVIWPGPRSEADLWMGFTSWLGNEIQPDGLQHLLARQIRDVVGAPVFESYFRFAFVRDPWDRMVSVFACLPFRDDLRRFLGLGDREPSFKEFLELLRTAPPHPWWRPQADFVVDEHGALLVDAIGRFERYATDAARILQVLGIDAALPHTHVSGHAPATEYYDDESAEVVAELYREDLRLFGYRKPS